MFTVVRELKRPSTSVEFFISTKYCKPEVIEYWNKTIVETGKQISITHKLSEDGLTLTSTMIYRTKDDWHDMTSDEFLINNMYRLQQKYNEDNGIVRVYKSAKET